MFAIRIRGALYLTVLLTGCTPSNTSTVQANDHSICGPSLTLPMLVDHFGKPYIHLKIAGREGVFLIDTGRTRNWIDPTFASRPSGSTVTLDTSIGTMQFFVDQAGRSPQFDIAGSIGQDFLRTHTLELHYYDGSASFVGIGDHPCAPTVMARAGFVRVPQEGYDSEQRQPHDAHPDQAVLFFRVRHFTFVAWIDSGYGDNGVLEVSEENLKGMENYGARFLPVGTGTRIWGKGEVMSQGDWQSDDDLAIVNQKNGSAVVSIERPLISVVKELPGHGHPPAIIGASYLRQLGNVVIDPLSASVWIPSGNRVLCPEGQICATPMATP